MSQLDSADSATGSIPGRGPAQQDASALARLLDPAWQWVADRTPARLAPNVITLLGVAVMALPTLLLLGWYLNGWRLERWLLALQLLGVVGFQVADAVDGKQARRTGVASPVGGWLDHACDIATVHLMLVGVCIVAGAPADHMVGVVLALTLWSGGLLYWETAHTRLLYLANGSSITEAQVLCMLFHLVPLVAGPEVMTHPIGGLLPLPAGVDGAGVGTVALLVATLVPSLQASAGGLLRVRRHIGRWLLPWPMLPVLALGLVALAAAQVPLDPGARAALWMGLGAAGTLHTTHHILDSMQDRPPGLHPAPVLLMLPAWPLAWGLAGHPVWQGVLLAGWAVVAWLLLGWRIARITLGMARHLGIPVLRLPAGAGRAP